jgi:hypothetical protein
MSVLKALSVALPAVLLLALPVLAQEGEQPSQPPAQQAAPAQAAPAEAASETAASTEGCRASEPDGLLDPLTQRQGADSHQVGPGRCAPGEATTSNDPVQNVVDSINELNLDEL